MALVGVMEFVNYLVATPCLPAGDTARIADIFRASAIARYGIALAGATALVFLGRPAANAMLAVVPPDLAVDAPLERRRFIRTFVLPSLLFGVALTALTGIGSARSMPHMDSSERSLPLTSS